MDVGTIYYLDGDVTAEVCPEGTLTLRQGDDGPPFFLTPEAKSDLAEALLGDSGDGGDDIEVSLAELEGLADKCFAKCPTLQMIHCSMDEDDAVNITFHHGKVPTRTEWPFSNLGRIRIDEWDIDHPVALFDQTASASEVECIIRRP